MIIACIQMVFYYYIIDKIVNKKIVSFFITLFVATLLRNQVVARAQLMSFPLFLLEFYSIEELLKTNKKRYYIYLGIIPFLLVSFHSSVYPFYFIMFVPYIIEFILSKLNLNEDENSKIIIEKHKILSFVAFWIIAIIAVFASPEGTHPILYIFKNMGGISSEFISELAPMQVLNSAYELTILMLVIGIVAFTKTKVRITDCLFILGFLLLSFSAVRSVFFYYLISSICVIRIVITFLKDYNIELKIHNKNLRRISYGLIYTLIISFMICNFCKNYNGEYVDEKSYPVEASEYILNNLDIANMRIYNHFNFGSYLEFRGIKTFLDSRSEVFTEEFNKDCTILQDWNNIINGKVDYKEIFDKYDITHAILYKAEFVSLYIDDNPEWEQIYEDEYFYIYEKIK